MARLNGSLSARLAAKLVIDVLPAAAASLIGSFLISQYQFHHHSAAVRPPVQQASPASAEMMQLVRDEHSAIMSYLKAELAAQQHRHAVEDEAEARAVAEAKAPPPPLPTRTAAASVPVPAAAPFPAAARTAAIMAAPVRRPLALTPPGQTVALVAPTEPAPQPKSLIAATLDVKDQVVDTTLHATWHAVSAIGSIPSWIASFGSHIGNSNADTDAGPARLRAS